MRARLLILLIIILLLALGRPIGAQSLDKTEQRLWLNQQIDTLFGHKANLYRLSEARFFPRCATPLIQTALRHPDLLDERNRFILYRPTDPRYRDSYYGSVKVLTYDTKDGHCRIHYTEDNSHADAVDGSDGLEETIPPYILAVAEAFETAWAKEVDELGYLPPISKPLNGDAPRLDCYIMSIYPCYGYSSFDQQDKPYLVIDSNYNNFSYLPPNFDPDGSALGAMRVTIAHEFFHTIQYVYTNWNDLWWEENTAVWMEDEVFDQVNDYLHYLGSPYDDLNQNGRWDTGEPYYDSLGKIMGYVNRDTSGWFDWPFLPLEATSSDYSKATYQEYGGAIWVKYLSEKYGQDIVRSIFQRGKKTRHKALTLIKNELTSRGSSLDAELEGFKTTLLTGELEESEWYPQVWHAACYQQYPARFESNTFFDKTHGGKIGNLDHLSAHYLLFRPPDGLTGKVHFHFTRTHGTATLACLLILTKPSGLTQRIDLPLDSLTCSGEITISGFGQRSEFQSIDAITINLSDSYLQDAANFTLQADFEATYQLSLLPGLNLFSPIFSEELDSHHFLLDYFTPDSLYSLVAYDQKTGQWLENAWSKDSISGPLFSVRRGGLYLLNMKKLQTITLPYFNEAPVLKKGINFFSLPPSQPDQNAFWLLDYLEGVSIVAQRNPREGKWLSAYHFFQKPSGNNFSVSGGETYLIETTR